MKFRLTLITSMLFIVSSASHAGRVEPQPVDVDPVGMTAGGDLWTARTDADPDVYIGCGVRRIADGAGGILHFAFCQAEDTDGDIAFCNSSDPGLVAAIDGISDFSYVTFSWEIDSAGNEICNRIGHSTQSLYLPEFKTK